MKRDTLSERFASSNIRTKLFNECAYCHDYGLKPGILETKYGDYGMRSYLKNEKVLALNSNGICAVCESLLGDKNV